MAWNTPAAKGSKAPKLLGLKRLNPRKANFSKLLRIKNGYSGFTPELKKAVLTRDGYRCRVTNVKTQTRCNNPSTEVHHIIPVERGGRSVSMNLIAICHSCHCKRPGHNHMR